MGSFSCVIQRARSVTTYMQQPWQLLISIHSATHMLHVLAAMIATSCSDEQGPYNALQRGCTKGCEGTCEQEILMPSLASHSRKKSIMTCSRGSSREARRQRLPIGHQLPGMCV